jgi:hypothetical protein
LTAGALKQLPRDGEEAVEGVFDGPRYFEFRHFGTYERKRVFAWRQRVRDNLAGVGRRRTSLSARVSGVDENSCLAQTTWHSSFFEE